MDRTAGHDDPLGDQRVDRAADPARLVEDELGGRERRRARQDRPLPVVEVEDRVHRDQVHVRLVVGVERSNVAPIATVAIGGAGHRVVGEVVDLGGAAGHHHRDDVAAHVVDRTLVAGVELDRLEQRLGGEDVVAHRGVDLLRVVGQPRRVVGLFQERLDRAPVGRGLDDPESFGLRPRDADPGDRDACPAGDVLLDHLLGIHAVDVVRAEDHDVIGLVVVHQVEALVDGVGRTAEPLRPETLLRRHRRDVVAEQRGHPPGGGDVQVERVRLVLRQHHDPQIPGVHQVRQHEVDESVDPAERDGRFRPVRGERVQALALTASKDDAEDARSSHVRILYHLPPSI